MEFTNKAIAHLLRSVAAVYLLKNEIRFKVIAYERAADTIDHLDRELKDIWENGKLTTVSGVGPSILSHIDEYFRKKQDSYLVRILRRIPAPVFSLMKVPGIGPKRAYKLVTALRIKSEKTAVEKLREACLDDKVAQIDSFGEKSQEEILKAINIHKQSANKEERMPLLYAYSLAQQIMTYLKKNKHVKRVDALGSLRRMVTTIGDIDLAVLCDKEHEKEVIEWFTAYSDKIYIQEKGDKKASIITSARKQVDLRVAGKENYGAMLQYFTGSKTHNIKLREYALKKGFSLSEYGIKSLKKRQKTLQFPSEEEFYHFLGLPYIPYELREGTNEIELALKHELPKLVETTDIKGDFHIHSNYDLQPSHDFGTDSYEKIVKKAASMNYEYVAFSDHNPSLSNHIDKQIINILKRRKDFIVQRIMSNKFKHSNYFISLEVDILPDGRIALPDKALEYVDMIIVSIHSRFQMDRDEMTNRILKGLAHPKVKILGHPTGRLLQKRGEIDADWERIFTVCKKNNTALEINAWPQRLDLPDILVRQAVEAGVKLVINTDSHAVFQMDNMFYGVTVARRGWAKKSDIINTRDYHEVRRWIEGGEIK